MEKYTLISSLNCLGTVASLSVLSITGAIGGTAIFAQAALAQVIPDATLGAESSIITPLDPTTQRIDGGAIRENHVFHSFLEFSIPEATGVYFADPANISTIFSRVTGANPSEIYGTLGVLGDANLFLLNPNGILFGPEAKLDMEGSFVGSTADSLMLSDGTEFSATDPTLLPMLDIQVTAPVGLVFEGSEPGVITNAGNLAVGQNLLLAGSTIVSTGDLTPTGDLALVTAVGNSFPGHVELTQTGELINVISALTEAESPPERLLSSPWRDLVNLTEEHGQLLVGESDLTVATGDIVVQQITAATSTLSAANDITLVESQLISQGNLTLSAQDAVQVRDSESQPVRLAAAGDLRLQGNEQVDLFALNHARSGLFSGGNMILSSDRPIIGDAHFYANGDFSTQHLDGHLQTMLSPTDPIILAGGNVLLREYQTGASLHILAGGSVTLGAVSINQPGPVTSTINPNNTGIINGRLTYADLATFEVPEYQVTVNADGTFTRQQVPRTMTIDGSTETTLDIRAGIDWNRLGGLPIDPTIVGNVRPQSVFSNPPVDGSITINGDINIDVNRQAGRVFLTNQYMPNTNLVAGSIETQGIDTRSDGIANGGDIAIYSRGDIITNGRLRSSTFSRDIPVGNGGAITLASSLGSISANKRLESESASISGTSGNAGAINLFTDVGDISTSTLSSLSLSPTASGNGGDITLSSIAGDITTAGFLISSATSTFGTAANAGNVTLASDTGTITNRSINARAFSLNSTAGDGGTIQLISNSGDVTVIGELNSLSGSLVSNAGDAGEILLSANGGNILGQPDPNMPRGPFATIDSFVYAPAGTAGAGGHVTLNAKNEISNLEVLTLSTSADSGDVAINGSGDLSINNARILTNQQVTFVVPFSGPVTLDVGGNQGQSGDVTIMSLGDITFNDTAIESDTKGVDIAGDVTVHSPGRVTFNDSGILSNTSSSGQAGTIEINATEVLLTGNVSLDDTTGPSRLLAQTTSDGAAGNVIVRPFGPGQTLSIRLQDNSQISAATETIGRGGNIDISAPQSVMITGAGEISASTFGDGPGGNIVVETGTFTLQNNAQVIANGRGLGIAGDIGIVTSQTDILNGAGISVSNRQGQAGNIRVTSHSLQLNQGQLTAATGESGDGQSSANIILRLTGSLVLSNESLISAAAFDTANGGNIDIQSQFLTALPVAGSADANGSTSQTMPLNGSDIIAIADQGDGGRITIEAQGIFGIEKRQAIAGNRTNDIDASSEFGQPGQINLNTLDDPSRNLTVLPEDPVNTDVVESCYSQRGATNVTLFELGLGGTPSSPDDLLGTNLILDEWLSLDANLDTAENIGSHVSNEERNLTETRNIECGSKAKN